MQGRLGHQGAKVAGQPTQANCQAIPQIPSLRSHPQLDGGGNWMGIRDGGGAMEPWYGGGHSPTYRHQSPNHPSRSAYAIPYAIRSIQSAIRSTYPHTDQGGRYGEGWDGGGDWMDGPIHSHMPKGMGDGLGGGIRDLAGKGALG